MDHSVTVLAVLWPAFLLYGTYWAWITAKRIGLHVEHPNDEGSKMRDAYVLAVVPYQTMRIFGFKISPSEIAAGSLLGYEGICLLSFAFVNSIPWGPQSWSSPLAYLGFHIREWFCDPYEDCGANEIRGVAFGVFICVLALAAFVAITLNHRDSTVAMIVGPISDIATPFIFDAFYMSLMRLAFYMAVNETWDSVMSVLSGVSATILPFVLYPGAIMAAQHWKSSLTGRFRYIPRFEIMSMVVKTFIPLMTMFGRDDGFDGPQYFRVRVLSCGMLCLACAVLAFLTFRFQPCRGMALAPNCFRAACYSSLSVVGFWAFVVSIVNEDCDVDDSEGCAIWPIVALLVTTPLVFTVAFFANTKQCARFVVPPKSIGQLLLSPDARTREVAVLAIGMSCIGKKLRTRRRSSVLGSHVAVSATLAEFSLSAQASDDGNLASQLAEQLSGSVDSPAGQTKEGPTFAASLFSSLVAKAKGHSPTKVLMTTPPTKADQLTPTAGNGATPNCQGIAPVLVTPTATESPSQPAATQATQGGLGVSPPLVDRRSSHDTASEHTEGSVHPFQGHLAVNKLDNVDEDSHEVPLPARRLRNIRKSLFRLAFAMQDDEVSVRLKAVDQLRRISLIGGLTPGLRVHTLTVLGSALADPEPAVRSATVRACVSVSSFPGGLQALLRAGVLVGLLRTMDDRDQAIADAAVLTIRALAEGDGMQVVSQLLQALSTNSPATKKNAGTTLVGMSTAADGLQVILMTEALTGLIANLNSHDDGAREAAVSFLRLVARSGEGKWALLRCGGVHILSRCLTDESPSVRAGVASVLASIASHPAGLKTIISNSSQPVTPAIAWADDDCAEDFDRYCSDEETGDDNDVYDAAPSWVIAKSTIAIAQLAKAPASYAMRLHSFAHLCRALHDVTVAVRVSAVMVVKMAALEEEGARFLLARDSLTHVLRSLTDDSDFVRDRAKETVSALADASPYTFFRQVSSLLDVEDEGVVDHALVSINVVMRAPDPPEGLIETLVDAVVVSDILHQLQSLSRPGTSSRVQRLSALAIRAIASHPAGVKVLVDGSFVELMLTNLRTGDSEVRGNCARTLLCIVEQEEGMLAVLENSGIPVLVAALKDPATTARRYATGTLHVLLTYAAMFSIVKEQQKEQLKSTQDGSERGSVRERLPLLSLRKSIAITGRSSVLSPRTPASRSSTVLAMSMPSSLNISQDLNWGAQKNSGEMLETRVRAISQARKSCRSKVQGSAELAYVNAKSSVKTLLAKIPWPRSKQRISKTLAVGVALQPHLEHGATLSKSPSPSPSSKRRLTERGSLVRTSMRNSGSWRRSVRSQVSEVAGTDLMDEAPNTYIIRTFNFADGMKVFPSLLRDNDPYIRRTTAQGIGLLARDETGMRCLEYSQVVQSLVRLMEDEFELVKEAALEAIVTVYDRSRSFTIGELMFVLREDDVLARRNGLRALFEIMVRRRGWWRTLVQSHALATLERLLGDKDSVARGLTTTIMRKLCEHESASEAVVRAGCVPKIMSMLGDDDRWVRCNATATVVAVVSNEAGRKAIWGMIPGAFPIAKYLDDSEYSIRMCICTIVKKLMHPDLDGIFKIQSAVVKLIECLKDPVFAVRDHACDALQRVDACHPPLVAALKAAGAWSLVETSMEGTRRLSLVARMSKSDLRRASVSRAQEHSAADRMMRRMSMPLLQDADEYANEELQAASSSVGDRIRRLSSGPIPGDDAAQGQQSKDGTFSPRRSLVGLHNVIRRSSTVVNGVVVSPGGDQPGAGGNVGLAAREQHLDRILDMLKHSKKEAMSQLVSSVVPTIIAELLGADLKKKALACLAVVACEPRYLKRFITSNVFRLVIDIAADTDLLRDIRYQAAQCIVDMLRTGGGDSLAALLQHPEDVATIVSLVGDGTVAKLAASATLMLSSVREGVSAISAHSDVSAVVSLVGHKFPWLRQTAAEILLAVATSRSGSRLVVKTDGLKKLVGALDDDFEWVKNAVMDAVKQVLGRPSVPAASVVLQCLAKSWGSSDVLSVATSSLLCNMSTTDKGRRALVRAEGVPVLLALLGSMSRKVNGMRSAFSVASPASTTSERGPHRGPTFTNTLSPKSSFNNPNLKKHGPADPGSSQRTPLRRCQSLGSKSVRQSATLESSQRLDENGFSSPVFERTVQINSVDLLQAATSPSPVIPTLQTLSEPPTPLNEPVATAEMHRMDLVHDSIQKELARDNTALSSDHPTNSPPPRRHSSSPPSPVAEPMSTDAAENNATNASLDSQASAVLADAQSSEHLSEGDSNEKHDDNAEPPTTNANTNNSLVEDNEVRPMCPALGSPGALVLESPLAQNRVLVEDDMQVDDVQRVSNLSGTFTSPRLLCATSPLPVSDSGTPERQPHFPSDLDWSPQESPGMGQFSSPVEEPRPVQKRRRSDVMFFESTEEAMADAAELAFAVSFIPESSAVAFVVRVVADLCHVAEGLDHASMAEDLWALPPCLQHAERAVREKAAEAIQLIASTPEGARALVDAEAVPLLRDALTNSQEGSVLANVALAIRDMALLDECMTVLLDSNVVQCLVERMERSSPLEQRHCAQALGSLALRHAPTRRVLEKEGKLGIACWEIVLTDAQDAEGMQSDDPADWSDVRRRSHVPPRSLSNHDLPPQQEDPLPCSGPTRSRLPSLTRMTLSRPESMRLSRKPSIGSPASESSERKMQEAEKQKAVDDGCSVSSESDSEEEALAIDAIGPRSSMRLSLLSAERFLVPDDLTSSVEDGDKLSPRAGGRTPKVPPQRSQESPRLLSRKRLLPASSERLRVESLLSIEDNWGMDPRGSMLRSKIEDTGIELLGEHSRLLEMLMGQLGADAPRRVIRFYSDVPRKSMLTKLFPGGGEAEAPNPDAPISEKRTSRLSRGSLPLAVERLSTCRAYGGAGLDQISENNEAGLTIDVQDAGDDTPLPGTPVHLVPPSRHFSAAALANAKKNQSNDIEEISPVRPRITTPVVADEGEEKDDDTRSPSPTEQLVSSVTSVTITDDTLMLSPSHQNNHWQE